MIQFLGPRSKTNKHIGMYASAAGSHGGAVAENETSRAGKKALSAHCELEFADIAADIWARIPFSELEIEIINQGTNDCDYQTNWRNIRL